MKQIHKLFLVVICILFLTECKKGEDDPAISLRTRKARLTGDWRLKVGSASITTYVKNSPDYNYNYKFDGSTVTEFVTQSSGTPVYYTGSYFLNINFKKDGSFNFTENFAGKLFSATGNWNFEAGVGKTKNKESIVLRIDAASSGGMKDFHLFNKFGTEFIYKLKELRNKKLVIETSSKVYINADGTKDIFSAEYTLIQ